MTKRLILILLALFLVSPAHAEDYIKPSWPDLVHSLVRFNALNLKDDALLDDYAIITECKLYTSFFSDDFKWNKVREALRQSAQMHVATYPTHYHYDTTLQLEHYDFKEKLYRFTDKATIHNINAFVIYNVEGSGCDFATVKYIPRTYRAVLDEALTLPGLPLSSQDAEALFKQMKADQNDSHLVYTRFNMHIVYIDALRKKEVLSGKSDDKGYVQSNESGASVIRLDVRLDSVDFFEDEAMTKLIYSYKSQG